MAKADRLERMEQRREELEADYTAELIAALKVTAAGTWGLFDHKADKHARSRVKPVIESLSDLADEIDDLRERLDMEPFALHAEFLAARGPVKSDAVGEPKQAQLWLERLEG